MRFSTDPVHKMVKIIVIFSHSPQNKANNTGCTHKNAGKMAK